jgi:two-component system, NarL family, nitrate/nitrite response regulator NarL
MSRCESRSNRASHARDTGGPVAPGALRPPPTVPGSRISVVVVDGDATGEGGTANGAVGPPIHVVGHASVGPAAIELVERVRPDVVLLAYEPGCPIGTETLDALRSTYPRARIVLVDARRNGSVRSDSDTPSDVVVTDAAFVDVVAGIQRAAVAGDADAATLGGIGTARRHGSGPSLTRREHEILRLVALGNTNNEIAQRLGLAANTVKTYWQRALHKLSARNRAEAIARAHDLHLI